LAKLRTGDRIRVDAVQGRLEVLLEESTWQAREAQAPDPAFREEHGRGMGRELFSGLRRLVRSAEEGAVTGW
jgi:phosphogluconate dehydratase